MKRFEFSLAKLLEMRLTLEESAQRRLADGLRSLEIGRNELACLEDCLQKESRRLEQVRGRHTDKCELLRLTRYRQAAQQRVRQQQQIVRKYEAVVDDLREKLRLIMAERKSLERLRDKEYRNWALEHRRAEQKFNDEIGAQRHARRVAELGTVAASAPR